MSLKDSFQIFGDKEAFKNKERFSLTIGNFDGVHSGHLFLIQELKKYSPNTKIAVITFDPHPATFFSPDSPKPLLTSLKEKTALLLNAGVDLVMVQVFSKEFSSLTADDFCGWLKNHFQINTILIGHDFCYGKQRKGNFSHMKNFAENVGWIIKQASAHKLSNEKIVSSSLVREALLQGDAEYAEKLLDHSYFLSGMVVKGDQRGRLIGFPTANILLDDILVVPKYGVYACYVELDSSGKLLPAVMNCGVRPTIASGLMLQIEAHILDFSDDIYTRKIKFHLKKFIRGEMKFNGMEQLKEQIAKDVQKTRSYFMDDQNEQNI
ncbi:bifunctional riboflavin kinase/FAD synthetase [Fluviispira multicolorata]|uniref:Riboflavin biosynthesis protein n=1 Tax=Fluviispira multicolorata TaxID=2654512 RepID=A0A833N3X4_9BACT|nr:bifunctional riboflavin kinase/FAD synthetase [Fluviispira multicolorata]KAB8030799.1 bifunctional riboflavin kinase/FAD synthetase [Fluviispira multicolorata]